MLMTFNGKSPQIAAGVFVAPTVVIIGDVTIAENANIWFGAVLRGDLNQIRIGVRSSIQDNAVLHTNRRHPTLISDDIIIGHGAVMEGCQIGQGCLIGMNATVLDGAVIGEQSIVAAGAVIREGQTIPPRVLVAGVPAIIKAELTEESYSRILHGIENYQDLMRRYENGG
jgi:carbonic anhydrase/acetyltransferase-like protein (isoleucine patch superfamily)